MKKSKNVKNHFPKKVKKIKWWYADGTTATTHYKDNGDQLHVTTKKEKK